MLMAAVGHRVMALLPFNLPIINQLPFVRFLGDSDWIRLTTQAVIFAIAALGPEPAHRRRRPGLARSRLLHGHRRLRRRLPRRRGGRRDTWGHELPMWIWLPGAGITRRARSASSSPPPPSACAGSTSASSPSGWCSSASTCRACCPRSPGRPRSGETSRRSSSSWWKEEEPVISFAEDGHWLWFDISGNAKTYLFCLALLGFVRARRQEPRPHPHRPGAAGDP